MALLHVTRLWAGNVTGDAQWHTVWTVPAGYRAVVHNIKAFETNGGSPYGVLQLGGVRIWNRTFAAYGQFDDTLWLVGNENQVLQQLVANGGHLDITVSGYLYSI